jgi:hypothetical protein
MTPIALSPLLALVLTANLDSEFLKKPKLEAGHGMAMSSPVNVAQANPRLIAVNVARMRIEKVNGGLKEYRAAKCMHGATVNECLVRSDEKGFLFRFLGGKPGWEPLGMPPTVESEVLISPDGLNVLQIYYNGPLR